MCVFKFQIFQKLLNFQKEIQKFQKIQKKFKNLNFFFRQFFLKSGSVGPLGFPGWGLDESSNLDLGQV